MMKVEEFENQYSEASKEAKALLQQVQNLIPKLEATHGKLVKIKGVIKSNVKENKKDFEKMPAEHKKKEATKEALDYMQRRLDTMLEKTIEHVGIFSALKIAIDGFELGTAISELDAEAADSSTEARKARMFIEGLRGRGV